MFLNYANSTLITIPFNKSVAWLNASDRYIHIHLAAIENGEARVEVSELHHHHGLWFYAIFWFLIGILLAVIVHMPFYALVGRKQKSAVSEKTQPDAVTLPPKYENAEFGFDDNHKQPNTLEKSASTTTLHNGETKTESKECPDGRSN